MKKIISLILVALLAFVIWATLGATAENIKIDLTIKQFVDKATYISEKSTDKSKYYEVKSERKLDLPSYSQINGKMYPGSPGDIICAKTAAVEIPIIYEGITYYVGGHAALCAFPYESDGIDFSLGDSFEITGFGSNITATTEDSNDFYSGYYNEFMVYRVDTSIENRFKAFNNGMGFYGQKYNYSFIFNVKNKKYCSDLIEKAYRYVNISFNYDGLATTVLDIMASPSVYLIYYSKLDQDGIRHSYALV